MKLKYDFEMLELGQEIIAVPVGKGAQEYRGVIKLNDSASKIFSMLKGDVSEDEILSTLQKEYDTPRELLAKYVKDLITQLDDNEMLE